MKVVPLLGLALLAACGTEEASTSSSLTRAPGICGEIETHVIGEFQGSTGGDTTVILARPGKHVLVLNAHEAVTWHLQVAPEAQLLHVYLVGYQHQSVDGLPAGADVISDSMVDDGVWANGYQYPNHDTNSLLTLAGERTHHTATSFHGCHTASKWKIAEDMAVTSDCKVGYFQADAITSCGDTGQESCGHEGSGSGGDGQLY